MAEAESKRAVTIQENLRYSRERILRACEAEKRTNENTVDPVTLIVVTKTYPESDVEILHGLGIRHVGENRDQEARVKSVQAPSEMCWHMIGQIQRNKINSIAAWADVIHTCDRPELVEPLSRAAINHAKILGVFVQINLDPLAPDNRGGVQPSGMLALAQNIAESPGLDLLGLMAVAPHPSTGIAVESAFERLAEFSRLLVTDYPQASSISAGMTGDLEEAIKYGATHVRLGSAILGERGTVE